MKSTLRSKHCKELPPGSLALTSKQIGPMLTALKGWKCQSGQLFKTFLFKDYYHTMAFVNAVAWLAHQENHHPDLNVGYNRCTVRYCTHSVGGLSENDFICAAKVDAVLD